MGLLGSAYNEYSTNSYSNYDYSGSTYSSSSSDGTKTRTSRTNPTTATKSKIVQTVKDIAQGYSSDLGLVEYYLREGDVDSAIKLKDSIFDDISNTLSTEYNFTVSEDQIESILDQSYTSVNGKTTQQTVEENTSSSFVTGLKEGIPLIGLLFNGNSKAETMANLSGTEASGKEKVKEAAGAATSGAATGAAIGAGVCTFICPAVGTLIGAGIGAAIGGVVGFFQSLFN